MRSNNEIMDILDKAKEEKGMSISEIARQLGMAKSAISRYFNRTREFPLDRIDDIAQIFNLEASYILGFKHPSTRSESAISFVQVPILGEIACGEPIDAEENISEYRSVAKDRLPSGKVFYLQAKGNSMEPRIPNGSYVLCREQPDVENGEIAAVLVNGDEEATLKKVIKQNDMILLQALNEEYAPYIVDSSNPARIIGKAIQVETKL